MAKPVLVRIIGDSSSAREAVEEAREELRKFSRENAEAALEVRKDKALRDIAAVRAELERIDKAEYSPEVKIDLAERQLRKLSTLEARLRRLDAMDVEVDVDVDRGAFDRIGAGVGVVERRIGGISGAFSNLFRAIPLFGTLFGFALRGLTQFAVQAGAAVGSLVAAFSGLSRLAGPIGGIAGGVISIVGQLVSLGAVAGGAVIALNAVLGAVVALGAALVALGASLTAAIGGLIALGTAFAGVLGPGILVVIGLFQRFNAILEARKAREQALEQATRDQRTADEQRTSALESLRAAQERLAQATVEGRRAMAQAAEDQEDAERSLQSARLGIAEARLNLRDARAELREFLKGAGAVGPTLNALTKKFSGIDFDPSGAGRELGSATGKGLTGDRSRELQRHIIAVQRAQLGVKDAVDRVGDSERDLNEKRRQAVKFTQQGIRAYRPYRQALLGVSRAERQYERSLSRVSAAQENYQRKLEDLSSTERGTLDRLNRFIDGFKRLAKAFTDPIFRAINDVFDSLAGSTGVFERGLKQVGRAIGDVVRGLGGFLRERATRQAFSEMSSGAAHLARELGGRAFGSFLRIMREVARAALPALRSGATRVADALEQVAGQPGKIRGAVEELIGHFKTWAGLGWQVLRAVAGIFRAAAPGGKGLAKDLTTIVQKFADWANSREGQAAIALWFRRRINDARRLLIRIKQIVEWVKTHLPAAAEDAKEAFRSLRGPLNLALDVLRDMRGITRLISGDLKGAAEDFAAIRKGPRGTKNKNAGTILKEFLFGDVFHSGGTVGGGANTPIIAQRGEEVIRTQIAGRFRSQLKALNAGVPPQVAFAGGASRTMNVSAPITVSGGGPPDPRTLAALLEMELRRGG